MRDGRVAGKVGTSRAFGDFKYKSNGNNYTGVKGNGEDIISAKPEVPLM